VPGKNIAIDESTVGFKREIILETYNPKEPNSKLQDTGDMCSLPYPEKPFI
jgi:hypothetical protein